MIVVDRGVIYRLLVQLFMPTQEGDFHDWKKQ